MTLTDKLALKFRFLIWARLKTNAYHSFYTSHSQFGEDMVLRYLTQDAPTGFYIDIGAHHPVYSSNTYHFYCKGWSGINIDALPRSMEAFRVLRPRDVNLEYCLSPLKQAKLTYFMFDRPGLNTCDPKQAESILQSGLARLIKKCEAPAITLTECLDRHLPRNTGIDLMSIDIEGLDEEVLRSNDWSRYRPKFIVFEKPVSSLKELSDLSVLKFLADREYRFEARCGHSIILRQP